MDDKCYRQCKIHGHSTAVVAGVVKHLCASRYTGSITVHLQNGEVKKIEQYSARSIDELTKIAEGK